MDQRVEYDEFGSFHENAAEFALPYTRPPVVRRLTTNLGDGRRLSSLVWGDGDPSLVFIHGGAQNAHTWDTVALALDRPLVAIDLPGHGHSDGPRRAGVLSPEDNATDVAEVIAELAPAARAVVDMSLGGLTAVALAAQSPDLVRAVVLVDITPGVNAEKSKAITDFVSGPATFSSFDELLARTIEHNPTRTESSLRRGILHNAVQLDDGTWMWRYRRFGDDGAIGGGRRSSIDFSPLWGQLGASRAPLLLVRGMRSQSVVDDADVEELRRRRPDAEVAEVTDAGHSIQGDTPVELAELIATFVDSR